MRRLMPLPLVFILGALSVSTSRADEPLLRIATFQVDATPPLGSPLCVGSVAPAQRVVDPLSARGIILLGEAAPIVLCSVDWEEISNTAHDAWCCVPMPSLLGIHIILPAIILP